MKCQGEHIAEQNHNNKVVLHLLTHHTLFNGSKKNSIYISIQAN